MGMEREKRTRKWSRAVSMKVPLYIVLILVGVIPMVIGSQTVISSYQQSQIDARSIEIQNQCLILSNKMSRGGYLIADSGDLLLNKEIDVIANAYKGRIVIVNRDFRIIKDTFSVADNKINVSEEVIRCFQGENSNKYNREKHYFAQTIPIYANTPEKKIEGVLVMTSSTEDILSLSASIAEKTNLVLVLIILLLFVAAFLFCNFFFRPFDRFQKALNRVAGGELDADISADTYQETKRISQAVSRTLKQLRAVDQSRQEFVSNVSHELKTPITSIRVLADSLMSMEDVPVELYREFMLDISDEIDRENKIIDDLLALVKADKSTDSLNVTQVEINALTEQTMKRLRPIANKRNVELIFESIREVTADVDETKFSLALSNLIENAIKYNINDGWVRVTLDADHKFFYIKVADSGIGIPEEFQERIFDRFFRVDKARSRETGGSGLGLAITRNVIMMHDGAIKTQSKEGEGTTFTVRIPLNHVV